MFLGDIDKLTRLQWVKQNLAQITIYTYIWLLLVESLVIVIFYVIFLMRYVVIINY